MKKGILTAALAVCLLLSGCSALLERSYSMVEPYADRYWDSGAEDTLKVDNYQDLVTSLLMLIEQRAEEAVIRCYDEAGSYQQIAKARSEVRWETMLGSYLLQNIRFTFEEGTSYSTAAFQILYREDAEDLAGIMTLSDSQSLVDLLRLAIREEHEKITARFTYNMPRESVSAAVESYWQELCREEMEAEAAVSGISDDVPAISPDGDGDGESEDIREPEGEPEDEPEAPPEPDPASEEPLEEPTEPPPEAPDNEGESGEPEPPPIVYPPCPWIVRFYPNQEEADLVEILLRKS